MVFEFCYKESNKNFYSSSVIKIYMVYGDHKFTGVLLKIKIKSITSKRLYHAFKLDSLLHLNKSGSKVTCNN